MSRKDYIAIAAVFADAAERPAKVSAEQMRQIIAAHLCTVFARDNSRFNINRWNKAANIK